MRPRFMTNPKVVKIREASSAGRAQWALAEPLVYVARDGRTFFVPAGFETDFASVPRIPLAYWLTGDTAHLSAALHDFLCRVLHRHGLMSWAEAALHFRDAMRAEGVPRWRAWLMYWAVRMAEPPRDQDHTDMEG